MNRKCAIGVDVGGSHISSVLVDVESNAIIPDSYAEQKVDNKATSEEILDNWSAAIRKTLNSIEPENLLGIGFAMPGPFDYENGISQIHGVDKYEALYGVNVTNELRARLQLNQSVPLRYLNDAMSFGVGECWIGEASAYENVVAITLGTGFGSAFLSNGVPVIEGKSVPKMGYVYHIPYENGIADDYFSTRWFIDEYQKRTGVKCSGVKEIADKANSEDEAEKLFFDFGENLGNFLNPLLKSFNADCLVIGGNISGAFNLFGPSFEKALKSNGLNIEIAISGLMETAAMAGSSRLADEVYWTNIKHLIPNI